MMNKNLSRFCSLIFATLILISCGKNGFNINSDPTAYTDLPVNLLLTGIEQDPGAVNSQAGLGGALEVYVHRLSVREEPNGYGISPSGGNVQNMWDTYYSSTFTNADIIIRKATADGNFRYRGIAKILKAYAASQLVDMFGDVPYSEATLLISGAIKNPKFDDDATIYPKLFLMLDDAIADIKNPAINKKNPGTDDIYYGGNVSKWEKMANTLKLKLYVQERKVKNVTAEVTALLANPATLISSYADNFQLNYSKDNVNPGYTEYGATQRTQNISPWFYEVMKGYNPNVFTNNPDPRIPYYWYNQIKPGVAAVNNNNKTEYRDGSFVSIYFGSNGPNVGSSQDGTITVIGLYPVGGKYDNGDGGPVRITTGTGAAPVRLITYADRLYLEAELINTGVIGGDAKAVTLKAINESFNMVDKVAAGSGSVGVPVVATTAATTTYINNVMAEYDAGTTDKKLRIIMTQKWISTFGSAVDSYTDYRRTGYPVLFDPNNPAMAPGGFVQPPVNGNPLLVPQAPVPVSVNRPYPLSLPWPSGELSSNSNAPAPKEPSTYKPFWLP